MILTTTEGQKDLPRYFAIAFKIAKKGRNGKIDFVLDDGRIFCADSKCPGPVCEIRMHDTGIFERLLREGQLGFCDALSGWPVEHAGFASFYGLHSR